jgi:hypothetical protein
MKRLWIVITALLLMVSLLGCNAKETTYTISKNGIDFEVDSVQKTISEGSNVYRYEFSGNSSSFEVRITYPDGSSYWYNQSGGVGGGGWSDDYAEDRYVPGDTLVDVVREKAPKKTNPGKIVGGLVLMVLGLVNILAPKLSWYLGYGWRYKNAEPSDIALTLARIGGGIEIVAGIILLLI